MTFEITRFRKTGGPLTKRIKLENGIAVSDGSACVMPRGHARRVEIQDLHRFADLIARMETDEAIALGALRYGLPDAVEIESRRIIGMNGAHSNAVSRDLGNFIYRPDHAALVLIDYDRKGMPAQVAAKIRAAGGFQRALASIIPEIATVARVMRRSTSAGLFRTDTGEQMPISGGLHLYTIAKLGDDTDRFLADLHARCYLAGFGWMLIGRSGALLERSIVDRTVGSPERLVFEGAPVLEPPLAQDEAKRRPVVVEGAVSLDTVAACPPLNLLEQSTLRKIQDEDRRRLAPEAQKARAAFIADHAGRMAERTGISLEAAKAIVERHCERRVLLPPVVLPFDDKELRGITVAEVLAEPERFESETLADPDEGVEYGVGKAKVLLRPDGTPIIHSFAHGKAMYELRHDAAAVRGAIEAAPEDQANAVYVRMALRADLSKADAERLEKLACQRAKIGPRVLKADLKDAKEQEAKQRAKESNARHRRSDSRASLEAPGSEEERLPFLEAVDEALAALDIKRPPARGVEDQPIGARSRPPDRLHEMAENDANKEPQEETR